MNTEPNVIQISIALFNFRRIQNNTCFLTGLKLQIEFQNSIFAEKGVKLVIGLQRPFD